MDIRKIKRVALGIASDEEKEEVSTWIAQEEGRQRFLDDARQFYQSEVPDEHEVAQRVERMRTHVFGRRQKGRMVFLRWISVVASAAAVVALLFFSNLLKKDIPQAPSAEQPTPPVAVQLVLPNGSRHELTEKKTLQEIVAGLTPQKALSPREQSLSPDSSATPTVEYNEIIVPRGKEYSLTLADGSSVTLNAETRLKFPNAFTGRERKIYLSGEAYFDIARDEAHPFLVEFEEGKVQVLGTQFNIKAYKGKNTCATLVSGKVKIISDEETVLLHPGQRCDISPEGLIVSEADLMSVLAWKNGKFVFKEASWQHVIDELARWYNVDITYTPSEMNDTKLHIYMERPNTLTEALEIIARLTPITYCIENKKVIIKKL